VPFGVWQPLHLLQIVIVDFTAFHQLPSIELAAFEEVEAKD